MLKAEANATKLEYEGYATAFHNLTSLVSVMNDDAPLLSMMFAESLSKYSKNTNLQLGFTKPGILLSNNNNKP